MGVFNKTIIPLALVRYEMIIANLALRTSLVSYHLRALVLYSEICCIALCVLHILGFSVPSIILADLLRNRYLLARVQKFMVCDFRSVLFVSCFKVRCFVIFLFRAIID